MFRFATALLSLFALWLVSPWHKSADAQVYGVELHNSVTPAAGAMGGVSLSRPQDAIAAINQNPATLTQFHGTHVVFGGAWAEPTINQSYNGSSAILNGLGFSPFSAKSGAPGSVLGNIAVTQDFSALGLPVTFGVGLVAASGIGAEYRAEPGSNGTSAAFSLLDLSPSLGVQVTDKLSLGAGIRLGTALLDGPFVGLTAAVPAYGLRGRVGATYELPHCTTLGVYYQTKQHLHFDDAVRFPPGGYVDIQLDLPQNFGIGIANRSIMDGRLLLAADVIYKQWTRTELFGELYEDQWVLQLGSQYQVGRIKFRLGYSYTENIMRDMVGDSAGGVGPPGGPPLIQYVQSIFSAINRHRVSGGIGIENVLPGVDMDLMAGGMFNESQTYGGHTTTSVEGYWIGAGITWRFGRGSCEYGGWNEDGSP